MVVAPRMPWMSEAITMLPTVAGVSFSTFVRFHSLSRRVLLLSLSMNLHVGWSGCVRKKEKR